MIPVDRLAIITWGPRVYLVREGAILEFCNAINAGSEPRRSDDNGEFFLKIGDAAKSVRGAPAVPAEWTEYVLEQSATGITSQVDSEHRAWCDLGIADGIRVGMRL